MLHLQVVPFQLFMRVLELLKFSDDFILYDKEFQTFGSRDLKLFVPSLT